MGEHPERDRHPHRRHVDRHALRNEHHEHQDGADEQDEPEHQAHQHTARHQIRGDREDRPLEHCLVDILATPGNDPPVERRDHVLDDVGQHRRPDHRDDPAHEVLEALAQLVRRDTVTGRVLEHHDHHDRRDEQPDPTGSGVSVPPPLGAEIGVSDVHQLAHDLVQEVDRTFLEHVHDVLERALRIVDERLRLLGGIDNLLSLTDRRVIGRLRSISQATDVGSHQADTSRRSDEAERQ